jgi:predicted secreted hydrolase
VYREALPGYRYHFPRDHFEHPDFRTEWWYYTGNVTARDGRPFGFELVFFRQGRRENSADNPSSWRVDDLYLAHLAITDIRGKRFRYFERLNRAGPGIAGASFEKRRVWNANWEARWDGSSDAQALSAIAGGVRLELRLSPLKPPVIHGRDGVSRKGPGEGQASHYVSFTRLAAEGTLDGAAVSGTAWMDHEWFSHQLAPSQRGWDWFSAQLEDGTDLMLFQLRASDGSPDPFSAGTRVERDGRATHLERRDFELQPLAAWTSPRTGARYPVRWRITVPGYGLALECAAAVDNQELASEGTGPTYWEGAVRYSGTASGAGYLELTGYDRPVKLD